MRRNIAVLRSLRLCPCEKCFDTSTLLRRKPAKVIGKIHDPPELTGIREPRIGGLNEFLCTRNGGDQYGSRQPFRLLSGYPYLVHTGHLPSGHFEQLSKPDKTIF